MWTVDQCWDDYHLWRISIAPIDFTKNIFCRLLQREWRSEALYDLQHATRIRLCRALRRPLLTERPCPALSPALLSATQWRPGCPAVTSSTRQSGSHAFSTTCRGTQTLTDSQTHSRAAACRSRDVIQRKEPKGHVYCILRKWLHRGAMCKVLHYSDSIGFCEWDFMKWDRTLNVSLNFFLFFLFFCFLLFCFWKRLFKLLIFFLYFIYEVVKWTPFWWRCWQPENCSLTSGAASLFDFCNQSWCCWRCPFPSSLLRSKNLTNRLQILELY